MFGDNVRSGIIKLDVFIYIRIDQIVTFLRLNTCKIVACFQLHGLTCSLVEDINSIKQSLTFNTVSQTNILVSRKMQLNAKGQIMLWFNVALAAILNFALFYIYCHI